MNDEASLAFANLGPDAVLDAVEAQGYRCDGCLLALNSYENRVYQVGIEDQQPIIAKFYRPLRWTDAAIEEEHAFCLELVEHELPVLAPLINQAGQSLHHEKLFRLALYERRGGHAPELDNPDHLHQLGRLIAQIHNVGAQQPFQHRLTLRVEHYAQQARDYLLQANCLPEELLAAYSTVTADLIKHIEQCFQRAGQCEQIRLHGDCHPGNILTRDKAFHLLDFDDCVQGPAVQDLWMFLSGDRNNMSAGLAEVLEGYQEFRDFNSAELHLLEALRSMRLMHYAAWLAQRWEDPAFKLAFTWFNTAKYWETHILELREQLFAIQEQPLVVYG